MLLTIHRCETSDLLLFFSGRFLMILCAADDLAQFIDLCVVVVVLVVVVVVVVVQLFVSGIDDGSV